MTENLQIPPRRRRRAALEGPAGLLGSLLLVYVVSMAVVGVLVGRPSTLGWIGFGVMTALATGVVGAAAVLFRRSEIAALRVHPEGDGVYRLLVVADVDVDASDLALAVRTRTLGRPSEVRVVAPVVVTLTEFLFSDEREQTTEAERRVAAALDALGPLGVGATGSVGTDDPLQAAGDALATFPADEILFLGDLPARRRWSERSFEHRARDLLGVHCATLYGSSAAARGR